MIRGGLCEDNKVFFVRCEVHAGKPVCPAKYVCGHTVQCCAVFVLFCFYLSDLTQIIVELCLFSLGMLERGDNDPGRDGRRAREPP